mmetsp:Transcript_53414/g.129966  ORF Transcript_53414/g.129966 Transcript_53414/m.129966 type:complete len:709 (-) Transcript_53414:220-2346(-)
MPPLSPVDEEVAEKYRKMLRMGMPEGAVMQRMAVDGIEPHIEVAVLSNSSSNNNQEEEKREETVDDYDPTKPRSSQSFVEEEIVYDDEELEEEMEALEEEIINEDGETEEEIVVEDDEPYVEDTNVMVRAATSQSYASGDDVEGGQYQEKDYYYGEEVQEQAPIPKPTTPVKELSTPSPAWYWISCLIMVGLIGAAGGVGYWLSTETDDADRIEPDTGTMPPTPTPPAEPTTLFSNIRGRCAGISDVENPNPVDQCDCFGQIDIIPRDVRATYNYNVDVFIPMLYETWDEPISSCTPQNVALVWTSSVADLTTNNRTQLYSLATTFVALDGSNWRNRTEWLSYEDPCDWAGIACNGNGYVTELRISENNANGIMPGEIGLLEDLEVFTAPRNNIDGPLPRGLFLATSLKFVDVSSNRLTGAIPSEVGQVTNLNTLYVQNNLMAGRLSASLGQCTGLNSLIVSSNSFEGEIPTEIFGLPSLKELDLGDNAFFGTIPPSISQLSNSLEFLTLGPNQLSGTIETGISELTNLRFLSIQEIDLTGLLPADFGFRLKSLTDLLISDTMIEGSIDPSFGTLANLTNIDLSSNQLRGGIPSQFGSLENLVSLNLDENFLDGQIPSPLGSASNLQVLRLNSNLLEGQIPASIGNLSTLRILRLESNRIQDRVLQEICDLRDDDLFEFIVDCPLTIGGELFGVQCEIPECCTACVAP